ncbi:hypothetical protein JVU11DRAFT_9206 [Chiua virens]|nr:hypothetical protein JVU11DRAFT_9206 [Chiua virens]
MFLNNIIVLHPQHKLNYFRLAKWKEDWIQTAEKLVCELYKSTYAMVEECAHDSDIQVTESPMVSTTMCVDID